MARVISFSDQEYGIRLANGLLLKSQGGGPLKTDAFAVGKIHATVEVLERDLAFRVLAFQELLEADDEHSARELLPATRPLTRDKSVNTQLLLTSLNMIEAGLNLGNDEIREEGRRTLLRLLAPGEEEK